MLSEDIYGFKKTSINKWYYLINLDRTTDKNKAEFYKKNNKEVKELAKDIQEQIEEEKEEGVEENARL
jgi:gas vesicle protein